MGYIGNTKRNGRSEHAASIAGDPRNSEGQHDATLSKTARQAMPDPDLHGDGVYAAAATPGRTAEPNPTLTGGIPAGGDNGAAFFNRTAPNEYPDYLGEKVSGKASFALGDTPD